MLKCPILNAAASRDGALCFAQRFCNKPWQQHLLARLGVATGFGSRARRSGPVCRQSARGMLRRLRSEQRWGAAGRPAALLRQLTVSAPCCCSGALKPPRRAQNQSSARTRWRQRGCRRRRCRRSACLRSPLHSRPPVPLQQQPPTTTAPQNCRRWVVGCQLAALASGALLSHLHRQQPGGCCVWPPLGVSTLSVIPTTTTHARRTPSLPPLSLHCSASAPPRCCAGRARGWSRHRRRCARGKPQRRRCCAPRSRRAARRAAAACTPTRSTPARGRSPTGRAR